MTLREKQAEQRRKHNEIREKAKEEATKREELKKGMSHLTYSLSFKYPLPVAVEIDQLYDKRRELISDFRKQQENYLTITREQRDAERTQRQEEIKRKEEVRQTRQRERYHNCCIEHDIVIVTRNPTLEQIVFVFAMEICSSS